MKLKTIFLLLAGESETKRPRSKKLLQLVRRSRLRPDAFKVIVSGLSSFDTTAQTSESERASQFLITHGVPIKAIVKEEAALDTLGNLVFSHEIIADLLQHQVEPTTCIVVVTEGFHMHRAKKLFRHVFQDISVTYPKVSFAFVSAKPHTRAKYYWQRAVQSLSNSVRDELILDCISLDIDIFHLHNYEDFKNYLFSLPVYNRIYTASYGYNMHRSIYAHAIQRRLDDRAANA